MTLTPFVTATKAADAATTQAPATNSDTIRLGGGFRLPPVAPVVADKGTIRLGGGFRLPNVRN